MIDRVLQDAAPEGLAWEPSVNAAHITVAASDGTITLSGYVETYAEKLAVLRNGWVTLSGTVDWHYQRLAAFDDICRLVGVAGVSNLFEVKPLADASNVREHIIRSTKRSAELDVHRIVIRATGAQVALSGRAHTWRERGLPNEPLGPRRA